MEYWSFGDVEGINDHSRGRGPSVAVEWVGSLGAGATCCPYREGGNGIDSFSCVSGWNRVVHPTVGGDLRSDLVPFSLETCLCCTLVFSSLSFGASSLVSHSDIVPLKWSLACIGKKK